MAAATAEQETQGLDRVLARLAMTDEDKLEAVGGPTAARINAAWGTARARPFDQ